jgi:hypothetical protein
VRDVDWDAVVARTEGATPAYIKELLRKAATLAAVEGADMVVTGAHLEMALAELDEGRRLAQHLLGFYPAQEPAGAAETVGPPDRRRRPASPRSRPRDGGLSRMAEYEVTAL